MTGIKMTEDGQGLEENIDDFLSIDRLGWNDKTLSVEEIAAKSLAICKDHNWLMDAAAYHLRGTVYREFRKLIHADLIKVRPLY